MMAGTWPNDDVPRLTTIWCLHDAEGQCCVSCHKPICPETLIRTFCVEVGDTISDVKANSKTISAFGKRILAYDRHFDCLLSSGVKYVTVSHVWDRKVSQIQNAGIREQNDQNPNKVETATVLALNGAIRTYEGIAEDLGEEQFELWYDYISVPQWEEGAKVKILLKIPDIYYHSFFTVVHLHDVDRVSVDQYRLPGNASTQAHLKGITDICNAQWFRRVWTAMEYIRSQRVRVMMKGYKLFKDGDDLFIDEMFRVWNAETVLHKSSFTIELMAQMGSNLVPWQLGTLTILKRQKRTIFAEAYTHLTMRGCSAVLDFFYATLGLVKCTSAVQHLERNPKYALEQLVEVCLEGQDYSPLLMVPDMQDRYPKSRFFFGLIDLASWGLGGIVSPAHHRVILRKGYPVFQAEKIGVIHFIESLSDSWKMTATSIFASIASIVLRFTGPNVENFVSTIGTRIYGQDSELIFTRLASGGRNQHLRDILMEQTASHSPWPTRHAELAADYLGLSNTGLQIPDEVGTMTVEDDILNKKLDTSNIVVPTELFEAHGDTMHLSKFSAIICATCPVCSKEFLCRAALYKPCAELYDAVAFRIPGLQYMRTLADGIGIIVKDGKISGRMIYACPGCPCRPLEEVEVNFPNIPMPSPNPKHCR